MAAVLLSKLVKFVLENTGNIHIEIMALSDSSVALSWIQTASYQLKTFVNNRVAKITETVHVERHVPSQLNAVDVCSRCATAPERWRRASTHRRDRNLVAQRWLHGSEWANV
ncbi:hypothetical protein EVAR_49244_1 [Eumeta japonica]|uniref:Uncharacterized protein n=1 Tax=Eumeta variegata TaxID=151549 RepID=A0A4C1YFP2_EUMVA|nr:hypothetical protein EVAR_49244_1 [Eumeta japonica]